MRFLLRHTTTYRYANPVMFGRHRLMVRPRDSHEMRLHEATLAITPTPSQTVWQYDVFGNSIALVDFAEPASALVIESTLDVERFPFVATEYMVAEHARNLPLAYSADEIRDLAGLQERHVPDPEHAIDLWAKGFLTVADETPGLPETLPVLNAMAAAIRGTFTYVPRDAYGTQSPLETLQSGSGTCRDFAYLMMEGARSLGLAARFVSGYIYDPGRDEAADAPAVEGGGATHAWAQIYLPGAGWMHLDPTNALVSDGALIPVAIVRDPAQASPVSGSWEGKAEDGLGLEVEVSVTRKD
ncbi:transglutaminase family protein [Vineibacter terrae]|uniref:Transglutaminase family protein n=1 Tax=Vineibacter terrae TaxID=2586908 RepID=A0A5C8P7P2_9HYPH|nr:transglutaminase family protein [Vineibacter terrae]TXL69750.1 transglutaminase family protein [Vineibacter terrae]